MNINALLMVTNAAQPMLIGYDVSTEAYVKYEMIRSHGLTLTQELLGGPQLAGCVCLYLEHAIHGEFDVIIGPVGEGAQAKLETMLKRFDPEVYNEWLLIVQDPTWAAGADDADEEDWTHETI